MKINRFSVVIALVTAATAPAHAGSKTDTLAVCMWSKMATSTEAFVVNSDKRRDFDLFIYASAPCDTSEFNLSFKGLKKALVLSRPQSIGPDSTKPTNVFVCEKGPDGQVKPCKAPAL